ncbi:MotA/TolQ/ExbB proton channel family protein [Andreprevotia chitinilytica]|uniref:MotA/TolQ/ExbB proton channel family protein n=1 Tax=Andreprevotia chitinilytica TaxID=396808 RepID=UPI00054E1182|nr:MotA/TolQ/ExbB proton channel family protein [Andreprevotia chitinilytica]
MDLTHINDLARSSGGTLYLMALLLFVGLTVIIDRGLRIRRIVRKGAKVITLVNELRVVGHNDLDALQQAAEGLPHARLIEAYAAQFRTPNHDKLEERLEESIYLEVPHIDRSLWLLDTVITVAPLLGLFGTIVGMFNAFDVLGKSGGDATQVTSGVAEALIATACGLFIAMSHLWFFNGMNDAVRQSVHQLETLKRLLLNRHPATLTVVEPNGNAVHKNLVVA